MSTGSPKGVKPKSCLAFGLTLGRQAARIGLGDKTFMKKSVLTLIVATLTTVLFGQGKIVFQNDPSRLIRWTTDTNLLSLSEQPFAGQPINQSGPIPSGILLIAGLYGGSSSASLNLLTVAQFGMVPGSPGLINPTQVPLPFPAGMLVWLQVKIWDSSYASYEAALAAGNGYLGASPVFSMTPGTFAPAPINGGGSTWPAEPIYVGLVPEPAAVALLGLVGLFFLCRHVNRRGSN